jgi:hypothetical protein
LFSVFVCFRPENPLLAGVTGLSKNKKENARERHDDLQVFTFAIHPDPPHRENMRLACSGQHYSQINSSLKIPCHTMRTLVP